MELKEVFFLDKVIFYNDDGRLFNLIFFYGNEWILMFFDLLVFVVMDLIYLNFVFVGVMVYFFSKGLIIVRNIFGRKNFIRKIFVDERFLI